MPAWWRTFTNRDRKARPAGKRCAKRRRVKRQCARSRMLHKTPRRSAVRRNMAHRNAARQKRRTRSGKLKRGVYGVAYLYILLAALKRRQRVEQGLLRAIEHAQVHGDRIGEVG